MNRTRSLLKNTLTQVTALCALGLCSIQLSAETVGWRTDASGSYDVKQAPSTWSDSKNVLWRSKMEAWSNTSPIILGDKIITCTEPAGIVCLNKADGSILWQGKNHYLDLIDPAEKAQAEASMKETAPLIAELDKATNQIRKLRRQLRKDRDNEDLKNQMKDLQAKEKSLKDKVNANPMAMKFKLPRTHKDNGFCSYIPVSDGTHVYAAYGIGTMVCYDLNGKRIWGVIGQKPQANFGGSTSPVLAGDVVVIGFKDYVAYDKKTGAEAWRVAMKQQSYGSPIVVSIGGQDVIVTPQGIAINAKDGSIVADSLFTSTPYNAPIVSDGILYVVGGRETECKAVKIPAALGGEFEDVWTAQVQKDRYYASPLLHDDVLYVIHRNGHFTALDAKTGAVLNQVTIKGVKSKSVYSSPTYAANKIYLADEAGLHIVFEASKELKEIGRNNTEGTRCNPVFEDGKMYMRTNNHVLCVQ